MSSIIELDCIKSPHGVRKDRSRSSSSAVMPDELRNRFFHGWSIKSRLADRAVLVFVVIIATLDGSITPTRGQAESVRGIEQIYISAQKLR